LGRSYAGILGPLACGVLVLRGLVHGAGVDATLRDAWLGLIVFSAVGYLIGRLGGWIVEDSVRWQLKEALAARSEPKSSTSSAAGRTPAG